MTTEGTLMSKIGLSIVIPVYNAAEWMGPTISRIITALQNSDFVSEIIVVDDGSSDKTAERARKIEHPHNIPIIVISQKNEGRYIARKTGVLAAKYNQILFIDSRIFIDPTSLRTLYDEVVSDPDQIWNAHVNIDKSSIFVRFWDAITCIAWRDYFKNPRRLSYGIKDFDRYPKGTTMIYLSKDRLMAAMKHFEETTHDIKHSSDDTLLLRYMNERQPIHISPAFSCLYHGRSNFKSFLRHAYHRGEFFIDGFLRPGTRFFLPLLIVLFGSVAMLVLLIVWPIPVLIAGVVGSIAFAFTLTLGALFFRVQTADALALGALAIPFASVYLMGLWRGVFRKFNMSAASHE